MKRLLEPHKILQHLAAKLEDPVWSQGKHIVVGYRHNRKLKAQQFPSGFCVSITVGWPLIQVATACLILAANPDVCDDSIYLEQKQVWLLRLYPVELNEVEVDILFHQQLIMAELLTPRNPATIKNQCFSGRFA